MKAAWSLKSLWALALLTALWPSAQADAAATIAVMPFDYSGRVKTSSKIVRTGPRGGTWVIRTKESYVVEFETHAFTNKLNNYLVKENKFSVVERKKLDKLIDEQKLGAAKLTDANTAAQMGKLLGADYFVLAEIAVYEVNVGYKYFKTIGRYKRSVKFDVTVYMRVVDTTTGKIVHTERIEGGRLWEKNMKTISPDRLTGKQVDEIQVDVCKKITRSIVDTVFPIKVIKHSRGTVYLNRGSNGGVKVGQVFKVVEQGEELVDEDTGLVLGAEEQDVALIKVTDAQKKFSKAEVTKWLVSRAGSLKKGSICRVFNGELPKVKAPPSDTTPPSVSILTPKSNETLNANPVRIWVESPDKDVVRVLINGVQATEKDGRYMVVVKAAEGKNSINVQAFDAAGNCGRASRSYNFDSTPPNVNASATVLVRGKVDDPNSKVTVNGQSVVVKADGSYEAKVQLGADRKVVIIAVDEFGNAKKIVKQY